MKKNPAKRTTIILDEEERKYIDSLIQDGKEQGLKPLISKMLDVYRSMMIYDWKYPGEYYAGISRIAFINIEFIDILLRHVPQEEWREVGKQAGKHGESLAGSQPQLGNRKARKLGRCLQAIAGSGVWRLLSTR